MVETRWQGLAGKEQKNTVECPEESSWDLSLVFYMVTMEPQLFQGSSNSGRFSDATQEHGLSIAAMIDVVHVLSDIPRGLVHVQVFWWYAESFGTELHNNFVWKVWKTPIEKSDKIL